jgi:spoIIIJ-associated protein
MAGQKESVFEGKTLDDAVRMGLNALRLSRAEVMISVLEEGSGGFLGLGARPYKVRVMPRPGGAPREPAARGEREDRTRGGRGGRGRREQSGSRGEGRGEPQRAGRSDARDSERGREGRGEPQRAGRNESRGGDRERGRDERGGGRERDRSGRETAFAADSGREDAGPAREAPTSEREGNPPGPERAPYAEGEGRRRRRGRRGGRGRGEDRPMEVETPTAGAIAVAPEGRATEFSPGEPSAAMGDIRPPREPRERSHRDERGDHGESRPTGPTLPAAELEARAKRATDELLRAMGFEGRVSARAEGDNVDVTAEVSEGEDLLTGRKGEVRQALQHLLNLTVNRGEGMRYHLQLEINDFWQRREKELEDLARSMADDAVTRGGEVLTEYLNAQERRIIHVTLREDPRVKTYAIGDGLIKKLAVAPADQPEASRETD